MKLGRALFIVLLSIHSLAGAQSYVYVTDTVDIPIRSENKIQRNPSNLLRMLPSGTKLQLLSTDSGWTQVKFEKTTGWMISRYLTSAPPAKEQLEKIRQTYNANKLLITRQKELTKRLELEVGVLKERNAKLAIETSKSQAEKEYVEEIYRDARSLKDANQDLQSEVLQLKTEIQLLQNNSTSDQDSSARNWFIVGAFVLFFGFIMGLVFPKRSTQRRY
ncbi:MAG: TIGR04211 family SH3 domain-containing protein [Candidatus Thioglobus sp.]|nr:MAG: TIGR04211 family SH3 domain-containing protein [Candidatus Thioglobus sp.]